MRIFISVVVVFMFAMSFNAKLAHATPDPVPALASKASSDSCTTYNYTCNQGQNCYLFKHRKRSWRCRGNSSIATKESVDATLSVTQLTSKGRAALFEDESILAADAFFELASSKSASTVSNDADIARFFHAATRLMASGMELSSDGDLNDGLVTLGDILDSAGFDTDSRDDWGSVSISSDDNLLAASSPQGDDLKAFVTDTVLEEITSAVTELENISADFKTTVSFEGDTFEVDYGDALALKTFYHVLLFQLYTLTAHDWDVDIDDAINNNKTAETVRSENSALFSLDSQASNQLSLAKNSYLAALSSALDLISALQEEGTVADGAQELIDLGDASSTDIEAAKDLLNLLTNAANESTVIQDASNSFNMDSFRLNLSPLFAGEIGAATYVPTITGNRITGEQADNTIGGLLPDGVN